MEAAEAEAAAAEASDAAEAPDSTAAAKGLNDNAHGIDRFGYRVSCPLYSSAPVAASNPTPFHIPIPHATSTVLICLIHPPPLTTERSQPLAQALAAMLKIAEPPICVGLYARWGSGKSFMISLLVKEFDPTVHEDPHTRQLLQFFEKGYDELQAKMKPQEPDQQKPNLVSLISGLLFGILRTLLSVLPTTPYWLSPLCSLIWDDLRAAFSSAPAWWSELKHACGCHKPWDRCGLGTAKVSVKEEKAPLFISEQSIKGKATRQQAEKPPKRSKTKQRPPKRGKKEFVFVHFNAWECAALRKHIPLHTLARFYWHLYLSPLVFQVCIFR